MGGSFGTTRRTVEAKRTGARERTLLRPPAVDNGKIVGDVDFEIAMRLRALRIKAGMSQTALGKRVGVSYQQMQKYEHGKDRIAASTIQRFADALGVQAGWFFDRSRVPSGGMRTITESLKVASLLQDVTDARLRRRMIALIVAVSGEGTADPSSVQRRLLALSDCLAELPL